jgi:hypothetical protein
MNYEIRFNPTEGGGINFYLYTRGEVLTIICSEGNK